MYCLLPMDSVGIIGFDFDFTLEPLVLTSTFTSGFDLDYDLGALGAGLDYELLTLGLTLIMTLEPFYLTLTVTL